MSIESAVPVRWCSWAIGKQQAKRFEIIQSSSYRVKRARLSHAPQGLSPKTNHAMPLEIWIYGRSCWTIATSGLTLVLCVCLPQSSRNACHRFSSSAFCRLLECFLASERIFQRFRAGTTNRDKPQSVQIEAIYAAWVGPTTTSPGLLMAFEFFRWKLSSTQCNRNR